MGNPHQDRPAPFEDQPIDEVYYPYAPHPNAALHRFEAQRKSFERAGATPQEAWDRAKKNR